METDIPLPRAHEFLGFPSRGHFCLGTFTVLECVSKRNNLSTQCLFIGANVQWVARTAGLCECSHELGWVCRTGSHQAGEEGSASRFLVRADPLILLICCLPVLCFSLPRLFSFHFSIFILKPWTLTGPTSINTESILLISFPCMDLAHGLSHTLTWVFYKMLSQWHNCVAQNQAGAQRRLNPVAKGYNALRYRNQLRLAASMA